MPCIVVTTSGWVYTVVFQNPVLTSLVFVYRMNYIHMNNLVIMKKNRIIENELMLSKQWPKPCFSVIIFMLLPTKYVCIRGQAQWLPSGTRFY